MRQFRGPGVLCLQNEGNGECRKYIQIYEPLIYEELSRPHSEGWMEAKEADCQPNLNDLSSNQNWLLMNRLPSLERLKY